MEHGHPNDGLKMLQLGSVKSWDMAPDHDRRDAVRACVLADPVPALVVLGKRTLPTPVATPWGPGRVRRADARDRRYRAPPDGSPWPAEAGASLVYRPRPATGRGRCVCYLVRVAEGWAEPERGSMAKATTARAIATAR